MIALKTYGRCHAAIHRSVRGVSKKRLFHVSTNQSNDQSNDLSNDQSNDQSAPIRNSNRETKRQHRKPALEQSTEQSPVQTTSEQDNQTSNQSVNQANKQPNNHKTHSIKHSHGQSNLQQQSNNNFANQSNNQSNQHPYKSVLSPPLSVKQSDPQSNDSSDNQITYRGYHKSKMRRLKSVLPELFDQSYKAKLLFRRKQFKKEPVNQTINRSVAQTIDQLLDRSSDDLNDPFVEYPLTRFKNLIGPSVTREAITERFKEESNHFFDDLSRSWLEQELRINQALCQSLIKSINQRAVDETINQLNNQTKINKSIKQSLIIGDPRYRVTSKAQEAESNLQSVNQSNNQSNIQSPYSSMLDFRYTKQLINEIAVLRRANVRAKETNNQSINRLVLAATERVLIASYGFNHTIPPILSNNQSLDQTNNELDDQSIDQSTEQSIDQSISQPQKRASQSDTESVHKKFVNPRLTMIDFIGQSRMMTKIAPHHPISQSINQSINQTNKQSNKQSNDQSGTVFHPLVAHMIRPTTTRSNNQSINRSIDQLIDRDPLFVYRAYISDRVRSAPHELRRAYAALCFPSDRFAET